MAKGRIILTSRTLAGRTSARRTSAGRTSAGRLSFSQIESALAMATKSNGKPISVRTGLGPDLQMRFNAGPRACGNTVEISGQRQVIRMTAAIRQRAARSDDAVHRPAGLR